jgi:hypothetical protein
MKNNSLIIMIAIVFAVTIAAALIIRVCFLDKYTEEKVSKEEITAASEDVNEKSTKEPEDIISEDVKEDYAGAENAVVELVERTTIEGNGEFETVYDRYIVSDVNFTEKTDVTKDYHEALANSEGEIGDGIEISFREAFDMSYTGLDGWKLYEKLIKQCGFSTDFNDVTFDEESHDLTGQNLYVYNGKNDVIDKLLWGETYDEILDSKVCYQLTENEKMPEYFSATVSYKYHEQVITKSRYLSVSIVSGKED